MLFTRIGVLFSRVGAPHHLFLQGVEEGASLLLDNPDGVCSFAQGEYGVLGVATADAVDGYEETAVAALYVELYSLVVCNDHGAHAQAMWRHSGEYEYIGLWVYDGSSCAE